MPAIQFSAHEGIAIMSNTIILMPALTFVSRRTAAVRFNPLLVVTPEVSGPTTIFEVTLE